MKQIETRCFQANKDYDWFSNTFESKFNSYENFQCADSGDYSVFLEIDTNSKRWKVFIEKFKSSRKDVKSRGINFRIRGEGEVGDEDSHFFYSLLTYLFKDLTGISSSFTKISKKLDSIFSEDVLSEYYDKRTDVEIQNEISSKLDTLLEGIQLNENGISDKIIPKFVVDKAFNTKNLEIFRKSISNLVNINSETTVDTISLVYADIEISKNTADRFYEGLSLGKDIFAYILTLKDSSTLSFPYSVEVKKKPISNSKIRTSKKSDNNFSNNFGAKSRLSTSHIDSGTKKNGEMGLRFKCLKNFLIGLGIGLAIGLVIGIKIKSNISSKIDIEKISKEIAQLRDENLQLRTDLDNLSITNDRLLYENNELKNEKKTSLETAKKESEEKLRELQVSCQCTDVKSIYLSTDEFILHTNSKSEFILHYNKNIYKEVETIQKVNGFTKLFEENKYGLYMYGESMVIENREKSKFYKLDKLIP